jgi:hypothetical protein
LAFCAQNTSIYAEKEIIKYFYDKIWSKSTKIVACINIDPRRSGGKSPQMYVAIPNKAFCQNIFKNKNIGNICNKKWTKSSVYLRK